MIAGRNGLQPQARHLRAAETEGKREGRFFLGRWLSGCPKKITTMHCIV